MRLFFFSFLLLSFSLFLYKMSAGPKLSVMHYNIQDTFQYRRLLSPPSYIQQQPTITSTTKSFTWLVFMNEKWVPFDPINQTKLEQTLTLGGTFVDITDSHFPHVNRVRVFPKNNYLSYLGVKYRLSRIMQPDAYLDHVGVAQANDMIY
jgi:hypothetical protein